MVAEKRMCISVAILSLCISAKDISPCNQINFQRYFHFNLLMVAWLASGRFASGWRFLKESIFWGCRILWWYFFIYPFQMSHVCFFRKRFALSQLTNSKFEKLQATMDRWITLSSQEGNKDDDQILQVRSALRWITPTAETALAIDKIVLLCRN